MVIQFLIIIYYLIPKVDLFYLPGSLTGIRLQDFIVLLLMCFHGALPKLVFKLSLILGFCIVGNILSNLPLQFVLGSLRIIEYAIIGFYISEYIIRREKVFQRFLIIVISSNFVISALQYAKFFPNFDPGRVKFNFKSVFGIIWYPC